MFLKRFFGTTSEITKLIEPDYRGYFKDMADGLIQETWKGKSKLKKGDLIIIQFEANTGSARLIDPMGPDGEVYQLGNKVGDPEFLRNFFELFSAVESRNAYVDDKVGIVYHAEFTA
jgi:hypothetical protein